MELNSPEIIVKSIIFEIYSAGYTDALNANKNGALDLRESFNKYFDTLRKMGGEKA